MEWNVSIQPFEISFVTKFVRAKLILLLFFLVKLVGWAKFFICDFVLGLICLALLICIMGF